MLSILLRPFTLFALLVAAALIARAIHPLFSEGPVKRLLYKPMPIIPRTESERRDWTPVLLLLAATALLFGFIAVLTLQ